MAAAIARVSACVTASRTSAASASWRLRLSAASTGRPSAPVWMMARSRRPIYLPPDVGGAPGCDAVIGEPVHLAPLDHQAAAIALPPALHRRIVQVVQDPGAGGCHLGLEHRPQIGRNRAIGAEVFHPLGDRVARVRCRNWEDQVVRQVDVELVSAVLGRGPHLLDLGLGVSEQAPEQLLHAAEHPLSQQLAAPGRQLRRRCRALTRPPAERVTVGEPQREALVVRQPDIDACALEGRGEGRWGSEWGSARVWVHKPQ